MSDRYGYDYAPRNPGSPGLWLFLSICSTLCCCLPFGIVGIVYSSMALSARDTDDTYGYNDKLSKAKGWTIAAIVCGIIGEVIVVLLQNSGNT